MKTAIDWLIEQTRTPEWHSLQRQDIIEEAKEKEKQQIIQARNDGHESTYNSCESGCMGKEILDTSSEQYYNETYGG